MAITVVTPVHSLMKLPMKREALEKINRQARQGKSSDTVKVQ